jgi:hypothetical protein
MPVRVAQSTKTTVDGAAADLLTQLGDAPNSLVIYFASPAYHQAELAAALHGVLGATHTLGCSSSGEIITGALSKRSVVAMALSADDSGPVAVQLIDDLHDRAALDRAIGGLEMQIGTPIREVNADTHVGIVLMDGLSRGEEGFLDALGDRTDLLFVGGSAGDDLGFTKTWVTLDGRASSTGAVLAIFQPPRGFEIIKTQSFVEMGKQLVATKVDEAQRIVLEFDGKPAADAYAAAIGADRAELPNQWIAHPLGLMDGGDPFVRSPQQVTDAGVAFFCAMKAGMPLSVLSSTDIVADTRAALAKAMDGGATGLINFNCILRTLDLEARGQAEAYGNVFRGVPTVGFSTYGEAYVGHVNQTATMVLLR